MLSMSIKYFQTKTVHILVRVRDSNKNLYNQWILYSAPGQLPYKRSTKFWKKYKPSGVPESKQKNCRRRVSPEKPPTPLIWIDISVNYGN